MCMARRALNEATIFLLRPYIVRELPGWGKLYDNFIGYHSADPRWREDRPRWIVGKLHGYEIPLDLGYWVNRTTFFLGRYYDLPTQLLIQSVLNKGDTFVDIGANEGMISLLGSRLVGSTGKVISFEPNPKPRTVFQAALDKNQITNVEIFPVGLGDRQDELTLTVPRMNSGEGSFGRPDFASDQVEVMKCTTAVGDEILANAMPKLIKIDVEGFELIVLRGLSKTIERAKPLLIVETSMKHLRNAGTELDDLLEFMNERDYLSYEIGTIRSKGRRKLSLAKWRPRQSDLDSDFLWLHKSKETIVDAIVATV